MAPNCILRTDALAQQLCQHLTDPKNGYGITPAQLDQGVPETHFIKGTKGLRGTYIKTGKPDGKSSPPEVYGKVLPLTHRSPSLQSLLKGKMEIPWIEGTRTKPSAGQSPLRDWFMVQVEKLKKALTKKGLKKGGFPYTLAMGDGLFQAMTRPTTKGGLGLDSDPQLDRPFKILGEIYRDVRNKKRKVTCLEFILLFIWAARRAGIPVVPVNTYKSISGKSLDHIMIGFKNPKTGKIEKIADIENKHFGDPGKGEVWGEIPLQELWAHYFNAKPWTGMDPKKSEAWVDKALRLVPNHYLFLYNKGTLRLKVGDFAAAKDYLLKSIRAHPHYPHSYVNLVHAADGLKDEALALWAAGQYLAIHGGKMPEK